MPSWRSRAPRGSRCSAASRCCWRPSCWPRRWSAPIRSRSATCWRPSAGGSPARRPQGQIDTVLFEVRLPRVFAAVRGRRGHRRGGRGLPDAVPQPAGVARHPGRLDRRRPRRRARHLPVAAGGRHPARGLRHGACHRRPRLRHRLAGARARPDPGAGAGRRGGGLARRRRHLAHEDPGRPLRPAAGHRLLAARQPLGHPQGRGVGGGAAGADRARAAGAAALAHQRALARRRGGQGAGRGGRAACACSSSPPPPS